MSAFLEIITQIILANQQEKNIVNLIAMKKYLCSTFLFFALSNIFSQNIFPLDTQGEKNKFVFDSLKNKLDNKRIICLGESEHRIETFSRFKTEFIIYLNKNFGYEVVAFEVGLLNISNAYFNIKSDTAAVKASFFNIWQTESVLDLYNYSLHQQASTSPLFLSGFDIKSVPSYSSSVWLKSLFLTIDPVYSELIFKTDTAMINACERVRESFGNNKYKKNNFSISTALSRDESKTSIVFYSSLSDSLKIRKDFLISNHLLTEFQYKIIQHSLLDRMRNIQFFSIKDFHAANCYRDSIMSQNILWLVNDLYKDKKIILWGHDAHIAKKSVEGDGHDNISSVEMLPVEIKDQIETISLNFVERAPKRIQKQIKLLPGNTFFINKPDYLNGEFEGVIYFKNTELIDKYKLK